MVTASAGVAEHDQGVVGGVINTSRQIGAALGASKLPAVALAVGHGDRTVGVSGDRAAMLAGAVVAASATLVAWRDRQAAGHRAPAGMSITKPSVAPRSLGTTSTANPHTQDVYRHTPPQKKPPTARSSLSSGSVDGLGPRRGPLPRPGGPATTRSSCLATSAPLMHPDGYRSSWKSGKSLPPHDAGSPATLRADNPHANLGVDRNRLLTGTAARSGSGPRFTRFSRE
jgi:hypothetical protein